MGLYDILLGLSILIFLIGGVWTLTVSDEVDRDGEAYWASQQRLAKYTIIVGILSAFTVMIFHTLKIL